MSNVKEKQSEEIVEETVSAEETVEGTAKQIKEGSFLDKLDEYDGSKKHIKPKDGKNKLLLTNWRWETKDGFADGGEALVFDVLNVDGIPTEPYIDEKDNTSKMPDLTTTSVRLIKALSPILRDAEESRKKEIHVMIQKFPGPEQIDTKYKAEEVLNHRRK